MIHQTTHRTACALLLAGAIAAAPAPARADAVADWNAILLSTIAAANPFAQARVAAMTHVAVFEAINAISHDYEPYLGGVTAAPGASTDAAAVAAAYGVLRQQIPAAAGALDAARAASLADIPDGPAKEAGIAAGEAAALAILASRVADGASSPQPYTPLEGPGFWRPTPPAFGPGVLLHWGKVLPFGIESGDQFRSAPPPALTSNRYRQDYNEVKTVGDVGSMARPADRTDVARFYAATSAVHAWNWAAEQAECRDAQSASARARLLALLNMAINDGLISSMETKYHYAFWRPVTAIRAGDTDGNQNTDPDPVFLPLIPTPAFPSYPSAHASASYAARAVLERLCGHGPQAIELSNPAVPGVTLFYASFTGVTEDIDDARVFGGIHFRFDQRAGARQGREVGRYVVRNNLRKAKR